MANGVMGFPAAPPVKKPSTYQRVLNGLLGAPSSYGGMLSEEEQRAAQQRGLLAMGSQLMAAGGPSPVRTSFGQALGPALMAGQQAQDISGMNMLEGMLLKTKLQKPSRNGKLQEDFEYAKSQGFAGSIEDWKRLSSAQPTTPADIVSFNDFISRSPEVQQKWMEFKRNSQPYQLVDVEGGKKLLNRSAGTLAGVTTAEQESAGAAQLAGAVAGAKVSSEAVATAKLDLPRLEQNTSQALQTIQQLKSHPGLPYITGAYSLAPVAPGTPQAGADALARQIQGKTFLEAYQTLKGGGAITEVEGVKAEAAIARLQRAQSRREYIQSLSALESVMTVGLERARAKASGGTAAPADGVKRIRVDANGDPL